VPAGEAAVFGNGRGGKLYGSYQERLKILNAADFGDLLLENIRLFREHPDVLRQYQSRFKYILVDEYQDTNVAQYLWLRLLSQAPAKAGAALSAVIPGRAPSPVIQASGASVVIPGRSEGPNPESRDEEDSTRDSGFAPRASRNDVQPFTSRSASAWSKTPSSRAKKAAGWSPAPPNGRCRAG